jgi:hypothetical protein
MGNAEDAATDSDSTANIAPASSSAYDLPPPLPVSESGDELHQSENQALTQAEARLGFFSNCSNCLSDDSSVEAFVDGMYATHIGKTQKALSKRQSPEIRDSPFEEAFIEDRLALQRRAQKRLIHAVEENTEILSVGDDFWEELEKMNNEIKAGEKKIQTLEDKIRKLKEEYKRIKREKVAAKK